jgi:6-pyruvoyltetrahydropterin/6-carboxytetrahydropterin synthase
MRTSVTRSFTFEAAHHLPWHPGRCRNRHGHGYRLEVTVQGPVDDRGVVVDFDELAAVVEREVLDRLDHRDLNDVLENPTAELIASEVWKLVEAAGLGVSRVRLWETADSMVEVVAD